MGWSDAEFWEASPKKYFTVLSKYGEISKTFSPNPAPLVGDSAINALKGIAARL